MDTTNERYMRKQAARNPSIYKTACGVWVKKCADCTETMPLAELQKGSKWFRCAACHEKNVVARRSEWRKNNRDKENEYKKKNYEKSAVTREGVKRRSNKFRTSEKGKLFFVNYRHKYSQTEHGVEKRREAARVHITNCTDSYIAALFCVPVALLPKELIAAKRIHLQIRSELKK